MCEVGQGLGGALGPSSCTASYLGSYDSNFITSTHFFALNWCHRYAPHSLLHLCVYVYVHTCVCICGAFSSSIDNFYGCTSKMATAQLPSIMSIWCMGSLPTLSTPRVEVKIAHLWGTPHPLPVISLQLPFLFHRHRGRSATPLSWP